MVEVESDILINVLIVHNAEVVFPCHRSVAIDLLHLLRPIVHEQRSPVFVVEADIVKLILGLGAEVKWGGLC